MFAERFGAAERGLASLATAPPQVSDEQYVLGLRSEASVKVRDGLMDVKRLEHVDDDGLEQWRPVMKAAFPLAQADVVRVIEALGASPADLERAEYMVDELVGEVRGRARTCWCSACTRNACASRSEAAWRSSPSCEPSTGRRGRWRSSPRIRIA